jgi:4-hydroxy-tetrahydrodipicolinate reductase
LTGIASKSLGKNFLSKIFEVHHKHKKDYPSGTALMLGKGIATGKNIDFYKLIGKKYLNKKCTYCSIIVLVTCINHPENI